MDTVVNRREFLLRSCSIAIAGVLVRSAAMGRPAAVPSAIQKGACIDVLPEGVTVLEKFEVAKRAGFDGIEPNTLNSTSEVNQYREAAERTGVRITSIMNSDHWKYPLSDSDPEVVRKCVEGLETSMHNAHDLGAGLSLAGSLRCSDCDVMDDSRYRRGPCVGEAGADFHLYWFFR